MMRKAAAVLFVTLFAAFNATAGSNNPPSANRVPTPTTQVPNVQAANSATDQGVRKMSRREKKERLAKLPEKYQQFLRDVEPIMMPSEADAFLWLETDPQRDRFIDDFWKRRDPNRETARNEYQEQYADRLEEAKNLFKYLNSDRGRIYLIKGRPDSMVKIDCDRLLQPIEVWYYAQIPGMGHDVYLLFYVPRIGVDFQLWTPLGLFDDALKELLSVDGEHEGGTSIFFETPGRPSQIVQRCRDAETLQKAIAWTNQNEFEITKSFDPPKVENEDVGRILRSSVIADPNAPKLDATFSAAFPGKRGGLTSAEMTLIVDAKQLGTRELNGSKFYNLDVAGEVLKDGKLFETYQYHFDYPVATTPEKIPIVVERFLRPANYQSRIKITDMNSGAQAISEQALDVPYIQDSPEKIAAEAAGQQTIEALQEEIRSGEAHLRLVPLPDELLTGIQHVETIATGDAIKGVEFYLDGRKVMTKRVPPYTLDLDFGTVPRPRRVKAVAIDEKGKPIAGDELLLNQGSDPFRVRIVSPRVAVNLQGRVRVSVDASAPEGRKLKDVEIFLNETKLATLYAPPYVSTIVIPANLGIGYIKAVANLDDPNVAPAEDVVFINTPEYMEEVNVHLIELPVTVMSSGKPLTNLTAANFKVFDEGKPAKISKFEYVKNLPLSIGMAIDTSGSMLYRMTDAERTGAQFFANVMRQGDKAFVVAFNENASVIQKWSPRLSDLSAALASLRAEESTALYDAIVYSLYNFQGVKGQKALVVITDGRDNASKFTFEQALEYAKRAAVPIYVIGINIRPIDTDARMPMNAFANETGGAAYYIDTIATVSKIYDDIQEQLRSQYIIGFYPPGDVKAGSKWREVSVQVSQGKAKTIRGYYP